jgi:hypothetical protein
MVTASRLVLLPIVEGVHSLGGKARGESGPFGDGQSANGDQFARGLMASSISAGMNMLYSQRQFYGPVF